MPNDCHNYLTIVGDPDMIKEFVECEFSFESLRPIPQEEPNAYEWHCDNWGTKWDRYEYQLDDKGKRGMTCMFTTAWGPPIALFHFLLEKFSDIWIKCEWEEDGGTAGVWVGKNRNNEKYVKNIEWEDLCIEEEFDAFDKE
jgi:hypothetical protein